MNEEKRKKLEANGFKVSSVAEFLELTPEENAVVELRLALSRAIRERRQALSLTQVKFARLISSSQSRLAKMEAGDKSVSLDLLIRSLLKTGVDRRTLSEIVGQ